MGRVERMENVSVQQHSGAVAPRTRATPAGPKVPPPLAAAERVSAGTAPSVPTPALVAPELERDEPGTQAIRRVLRQQVKKALDALERTPLSDEAVHSARKDLRRARATLRLLREALGRRIYSRENASLRDIARPLSRMRDGKVLSDQLETLLQRGGTAARAWPLEALRRELKREHHAARRQLLRNRDGLQLQVDVLRHVYERSARWRVGYHSWSILGAGLRHVYARGRKHLTLAAARRSSENLHEWRKQTKYLWHQLQLLRPLWPGLIGELADQAHKLADYLGDDHDLAVLRQRLIDHGDLVPSRAARSALIALIDQRRTELEDKAFVLGERIYEERAPAFAERIGRYWRDWHRAQVKN